MEKLPWSPPRELSPHSGGAAAASDFPSSAPMKEAPDLGYILEILIRWVMILLGF